MITVASPSPARVNRLPSRTQVSTITAASLKADSRSAVSTQYICVWPIDPIENEPLLPMRATPKYELQPLCPLTWPSANAMVGGDAETSTSTPLRVSELTVKVRPFRSTAGAGSPALQAVKRMTAKTSNGFKRCSLCRSFNVPDCVSSPLSAEGVALGGIIVWPCPAPPPFAMWQLSRT